MIQTPQSSNIAAFGYDNATNTLTVKFKSGGTYHYHGVPSTIYTQMQVASSKGSFVAQYVKDRYRFTRE